MSASTFRELLSTPTDQVKAHILAEGHYLATIKGHEFGTSRQKQTPQVQFILGIDEETSDVPQGANDGINLSEFELRRTYYITPKALKMLANALDAMLGAETGRSFDERIPDTRGVRVMVGVAQRNDEQGNPAFNDVTTIVKA